MNLGWDGSGIHIGTQVFLLEYCIYIGMDGSGMDVQGTKGSILKEGSQPLRGAGQGKSDSGREIFMEWKVVTKSQKIKIKKGSLFSSKNCDYSYDFSVHTCLGERT